MEGFFLLQEYKNVIMKVNFEKNLPFQLHLQKTFKNFFEIAKMFENGLMNYPDTILTDNNAFKK